MAPRVLLQPGQVWTPTSQALSSRHILDMSEGVISYAKISAGVTGEDYILSQSLFRRWIRETGAAISETRDTKSSPAIELAKKIASLRKAAGMSQENLAKALNLSRSAIAAMETGRKSRASKHLPALAEIFQVPITLFLNGMSDHPVQRTLTSDENILIDLYQALTPERKVNVQKYVERQSQK